MMASSGSRTDLEVAFWTRGGDRLAGTCRTGSSGTRLTNASSVTLRSERVTISNNKARTWAPAFARGFPADINYVAHPLRFERAASLRLEMEHQCVWGSSGVCGMCW